MIADINRLPPNTDPGRQMEYVRQWVAQKKAQQVFKPSQDTLRRKFQGSIVSPPTSTTSTTQAPQDSNDEKRKKAKMDFYRQIEAKQKKTGGTGRFPTDQELEDFIKNGNKL
jgi:hypothetical protein